MHLLEVRKEAVFQLSKMHGAERELVDTLVLEIDTQLEELRNAMDLDQTNDGEQTVAEQKAAPLAETIKSEGSVESGKTL
jgi:hypothetical protein